jgi:hypothetical protein
MSSAKKMCFDRVIFQNLRKEQRVRPTDRNVSRAINPVNKQWMNGSTLRIRFMDGRERDKDMVRQVAPEWTHYANLSFEFTDDPRAEIRVSFDESNGAWSYVGTDNLTIPNHAATLNLGWVDEGVILHEFGHMIGLAHEHQNPEGGIIWNPDAVIRDLSGPPNYWDVATIEHNVLRKYSADQVNGTAFDPNSIMLYAFPDAWTKNMGATHENNHLSDIDKTFIKSARMYPGRTTTTEAVPMEVYVGQAADIKVGGEQDVFKFKVDTLARYTIETRGAMDVCLSLFGPNSPEKLIASDDDSGVDFNAKIQTLLEPGEYSARVRGYDDSDTGRYRIRVVAD